MTLNRTIESYREYLLTLPDHRRRFEQRLNDHPPAARAEAAIFAYLRDEGCNPLLNEDITTGGADFCCQEPERFVVEVTSLEDQVMAARAGTKLRRRRRRRARHAGSSQLGPDDD